MSKEAERGLFESVDALPDNADMYQKTTALAADYFRQGKGVDWVIQNVCGTRVAQRRMVLSLAQTMRVITAEERKVLGIKYCGEKEGSKFKKR